MNRYRVLIRQETLRRYTIYATNAFDAAERALETHELVYYQPYPHAESLDGIFTEGFDDPPELCNIEDEEDD